MPAIKGAAGYFGATRQQRLPALARKAAAKYLGWPSEFHGGPRENGTCSGSGAIAAVGTKSPWPQCGHRAHAARSMRCMKAATDSTTTGSGAGTESAARARASFTALPEGPRRP